MAVLALWLTVALSSSWASPPPPPGPLRIVQAEAVRAGWDSQAPPAEGWTPVRLMDFWDARWPAHDGVVWYRLHWRQDDASQPVGLLLDYACLGNAVYVNGSLIARDPRLVEPLSRSWFKPQYFLLDRPLLREGENTLLVRVSGLSAYQPGFGPVAVGDPAVVRAQYERGVFKRYTIKLINFAMSAVLGVIFLLVWLLRRRDTVFGWFALTQLAGSLYGYNYIAPSPWPFSTTDGWQAMNVAWYMLAATTYALFLFRFGERRFPKLERAMWLVCAVTFAAALLTPHWTGLHRAPWYALAGLFYYAAIGWFMWHAVRVKHADYRVLAACLVVPVLVSFHDFALFFGWVRGDTYLLALTSVLTLIGIAFALAYRFVAALRRVENFNVELKREVDAATARLADTLAREHALALAHSRAGERLQLTRDLHDGFGGTLVGAIARLEQAPEDTPKAKVVAILKDMRDDLRLVIDSTAREHADLDDMLAPLRHRSAQLLEAVDIESHWRVDGVEGIELGGVRSLDLLRLLQEALTNVFKHSGATRVDVHLEREGERLRLRIRDNGRGFPDAAGKPSRDGGAGLASMRLRAQRLGGALQVESTPQGVCLQLEFPLAM